MFDLTSSKLFLLAVVALLVIGPKDFPLLLRTIGKYIGIIRGHAKEFRAQFDEAIRDSELSQLKKDMENIGRETEASLNATKQSVEQTIAEARQGVEASADPAVEAPKAVADPLLSTEAPVGESAGGVEAPAAPPDPASTLAPPPAPAETAGAGPAVERTGA
jgi:sec-independent protein translocase protein TatB